MEQGNNPSSGIRTVGTWRQLILEVKQVAQITSGSGGSQLPPGDFFTSPPGDGNSNDGDNGEGQDEVRLTPIKRVKIRFLTTLFILVLIIVLADASLMLAINANEYIKLSDALQFGTDIAAYKAMVEASKIATDIFIDRLADIMLVSSGVLVGLFLNILADLKNIND